MLSNSQDIQNASVATADNNLLPDLNANLDSDEDEDIDNNDSDNGFEDERAYTLAVIVNTDFMYNEVTEVWRRSADEMQKICQNLPND